METQVLGAALTIAVALIMWQLRSLARRIDRSEDRAEKRAAEDRAAADKRAAEDRAAAAKIAAEDRAAAAKIAAEDRAANKADHDKLFQLVASLQADVKVLKDRSDRAERKSAD